MQDHGDFGNQHGRGFSQGTGQSVANGAAEPTVRQVGHAQPPSSCSSFKCFKSCCVSVKSVDVYIVVYV